MRPALLVFILFFIVCLASAQDLPSPETITRQTADDIALVADFHPAPDDTEDPPLILLLHMLNSNRAAYDPLLPDLSAAGYALLNIDMRGHGDSGGARDWDLAIADIADWIAWLDDSGQLGESGLAIIGGSIGANVAIIGCAESAACRGVIALSPGLDYRGVRPESALVDGLADRAALLVAAHADSYSAETIEQLFAKAKGDVSARLYRGRAHGTRLFDSNYQSVSRLLLNWLAELFSTEADAD